MYDLAVIGAGPGGYVAAIRAAQLGFQTALIDSAEKLGGTCLNIGCVPSKALLDLTHKFHYFKHDAPSFGITADNVSFQLEKMMDHKSAVVDKFTKGVAGLVKGNNIDSFTGTASIPEPGVVNITGSSQSITIQAKRILLATGSKPREIPGMEFDGSLVIDSTNALCLNKVPKHMIIAGAGAIGLEMASIWSRLGAKVTVVEIMPHILPGWDQHLAKLLLRELKHDGIEFYLKSKAVITKKTKVSISVHIDDGNGNTNELKGDVLLVAAGRIPNISISKIGNTDLQLTERGFIQIDNRYCTNISDVYAIGDIVPGPMLAHKAEEEGIAVVEKMAGLPGITGDYIPGVVYTQPEAAAVGYTEEQLKKLNIRYNKGQFSFAANSRSMAQGEGKGIVKVLADVKTDKVLGVHILGSDASELISEAVTVMEFGGSSEDIARTIHAHPTLSETVKEAALAATGRAIHAMNGKISNN